LLLVAFFAGALTAVLPWTATVARCAPPPDSTSLQLDNFRAQHRTSPVTRLARVLTAAPTGLGLIAARWADADLCFFHQEDLYVATFHRAEVQRRGFTVGNTFLTRHRDDDNSFELMNLYHHEARHRGHWAVFTVVGGPLAFPVAYTVDELFFPGRANHFERLAGVFDGHYWYHPRPHAAIGAWKAAVSFAAMATIEAAFVLGRRPGARHVLRPAPLGIRVTPRRQLRLRLHRPAPRDTAAGGSPPDRPRADGVSRSPRAAEHRRRQRPRRRRALGPGRDAARRGPR
jgi:hypothetical protein